jgi:hypothetical protein
MVCMEFSEDGCYTIEISGIFTFKPIFGVHDTLEYASHDFSLSDQVMRRQKSEPRKKKHEDS